MLPDSHKPSEPEAPAREISPRKLEANRANARKSTGPKTPEGKARSAMNALKYQPYDLPNMSMSADEAEEAELLQAVDDDARIERTRRMPVTDDKPLSEAARERTIQNIREYVYEKKLLKVSELATMSGASVSTVSEVLNRKYRGDVDEMLRLLDATVADYARKAGAPGTAKFVRTAVARQIHNLLRLASRTKSMAAFWGHAGCGKTTSLKAALSGDFKHALYVCVDAETASPLHLLQSIASQLQFRGLHPRQWRSKAELFKLIRIKLTGSGKPILIDEADNLTPEGFNIMRQLHDATPGDSENPCVIVFAGRDPLPDVIKAASRCRKIGGSLSSRISLYRCITDAGQDSPSGGGKWLFSIEDITEMLAKRRVHITPEAARWLCCLANLSLLTEGAHGDSIEGGGVRLAMKVAVNAAAVHKADGPVELAAIIKVYRYLFNKSDAKQMEAMIQGALSYAPTTLTAAG